MAEPITILGIAGSLRKGSWNRGALRAAQKLLPEGARLEICDLHGIPPFNQDEEGNPHPKVAELKQRIRAAHFTAIGALREVTLGYFERDRKDYKRMAVTEQVEVLSLIGDIALDQKDAPKVHAHIVIGLSDGQTRGGHLLAARVWPTIRRYSSFA